MKWIFIFTIMITILNIVTMFKPFTPPHYEQLDPRSWWLFYPCFFYQLFWWSTYFQLL